MVARPGFKNKKVAACPLPVAHCPPVRAVFCYWPSHSACGTSILQHLLFGVCGNSCLVIRWAPTSGVLTACLLSVQPVTSWKICISNPHLAQWYLYKQCLSIQLCPAPWGLYVQAKDQQVRCLDNWELQCFQLTLFKHYEFQNIMSKSKAKCVATMRGNKEKHDRSMIFVDHMNVHTNERCT